MQVDHLLLKENAKLTQAGIVLMPNGCMCCAHGKVASGALELEEVLRNLLKLSQQQGGADMQGASFEYVLIETSGLADPGPLIAVLSRLDARFYLDGTVTLVDSTNARRILADESAERYYPEAARQVAFADVIVVTKVERASSPDTVPKAIARLRSINGSARILSADDHFKCTDVLQLLHLQRLAEFLPECAATAGVSTTTPACPSAASARVRIKGSRAGGSEHAIHGVGVSSVSIQTGLGDGPHRNNCCASVQLLESWITRLVRPHSAAHTTGAAIGSVHEIWRVKGIFAVTGDPRQLLLHAVFGDVQVAAGARWDEDEPRCCRIVFIGVHLDEMLLRSQFAELLAAANPDGPTKAPMET